MSEASAQRDSDDIMFPRQDDTRPTLARLAHAVRDRIADEAFERYLDWRDEAATVELAYRHWTTASSGKCALAFASYKAALDREERAAIEYCVVHARADRLLSERAERVRRFGKGDGR